MNDALRAIAARIKELRDIDGVSLETLAHELGLPSETYEAYEKGGADIPVGVLYQLANRFGVELTALLTGTNPRLHTYCLVRKGQAVKVERRKEYHYQSLAFNFANKKMEPFLVKVDPSPAGTALARNSHPGHEFDYVLEGSMTVIVDDHEVTLEAGDSLFFDSSLSHAMAARNERPCTFIAVIS